MNFHQRLFALISFTTLLALQYTFAVGAAQATTYYLATSTAGGNDSNPGTSQQPWATFNYAFSQILPGDTLLVKDGTYSQSISPTDSGTPGNPIIIKAENDGKAVIDGQGLRSGIVIYNKEHITIEGFLILNPGERHAVMVGGHDGPDWSDMSNNIIIRRTGARGGANDTNNHVWSVARTKDSLFEDIWGWGPSRYVMNVYGSDNITVRRAVLRWDRWDGLQYKPNDPKFNLGIYNTHNSTIENVILIDGGDRNHGALTVSGKLNGNTAPYTGSSYNDFYGAVLLNNKGTGINVEAGADHHTGNTFTNVVSWDNGNTGLGINERARDTRIKHVTLGENTRHGTFFNPYGDVTGTILKNSLIYNNGLRGINGSVTDSFNNVYGNGDNYPNGSPGMGDISQDPELRYILKLEENKPGRGQGDNGGDMAARVLKRYVDGVLTTQDLWPWPNEETLRTTMCDAAYLQSIGRTGTNESAWCSSNKTLTKYIWEYLGNPIPEDIYGCTPPHTPGCSGLSLDVQANGSDGPITIPVGAPLDIAIHIDPADQTGQPADWWIVARTPMGYYWFTARWGWIRSVRPLPAYQGPLFSLTGKSLLSSSRLPAGNYTFYFAVDDNQDGVMDLSHMDSAGVHIQ